MPKTYLPCADHDQSVLDMADSLLRRYYQDLIEAELRIYYLFVATDEVKPALTSGGYPVPALIKVNSLKCRVEGKADCTLTIDKNWYDGVDKDKNVAAIDQQLYRITLAQDDEGKYERDDIGRPRVRLRPYDITINGFHEIAKRHRFASVEVAAFNEVAKAFVQGGLFGGDDMRPGVG